MFMIVNVSLRLDYIRDSEWHCSVSKVYRNLVFGGDARDALVGHYTRAKVAVQHDRGAFGNCQNVAVVKECLKKKV